MLVLYGISGLYGNSHRGVSTLWLRCCELLNWLLHRLLHHEYCKQSVFIHCLSVYPADMSFLYSCIHLHLLLHAMQRMWIAISGCGIPQLYRYIIAQLLCVVFNDDLHVMPHTTRNVNHLVLLHRVDSGVAI